MEHQEKNTSGFWRSSPPRGGGIGYLAADNTTASTLTVCWGKNTICLPCPNVNVAMRWRRYLCSHPHILWQGKPKCTFLPLLPCSLPFRNTRFKKKGTCMVCWNGRPKESGHDTMKMFEIILLMGHWCSALFYLSISFFCSFLSVCMS